ncbi:uncharacterized protein LOC128386594 [Panonychus citri]|uniref:uncharacterized protein LOC128386594 n=1 Tax=Panonychus citri TaxID=50023 RepID=UPI00230787F7|nr:uncharacterized protein LOC128386594 [Panonychus citri]
MISAMPAVAVRREREKNRQGKLIGDPFARGSYIAGHQLHHLPTSYYHPHHLHHHHHNSSNQQGNKSIDRNHNSSDCVNISSEDKNGLTFLIYSGFGCLAIGLIFLLIGIVTIKLPSQIIGLVFIGLGGLFCVIKVILNGKSSSSSSSLSSPPRATTTTTTTSGN